MKTYHPCLNCLQNCPKKWNFMFFIIIITVFISKLISPSKKKLRELYKTSFTCNYEMYLQVVKAFMDNL